MVDDAHTANRIAHQGRHHQMKTLTITYAGVRIFDGPVDEFQWIDTETGVTVTGKTKPPARPAGGGLLELLTSAAASRRPQPAAQAASTDDQIDAAETADEQGAP